MPGQYSSPIVIFRITGLAHSCRIRLKIATMTSRSACVVSQFGSMSGGSLMLDEVMATVPWDVGVISVPIRLA